ncbi:MAG: metallophosphoesterase [Actinomycetota bacterium]
MSRFFKAAARAVIILVLVCLGLTGALLSFLHSPFFRYPTDGEYPQPRIDELIWPTIGCPAMVVPGEVLAVEVDLDSGDAEVIQADASGWQARLRPSRAELAGISLELKAVGAKPGPSERWPERAGVSGAEVWHVSFRVPAEAVPELYDLTLEVDVGGEHVSDTQPHAVALVEDADGDFTFVTLSDVHVHEPNNSSLAKHQTDKGISEDGEPLFFEAAIAQVNLIRPDLVVMLGDFVRGQRRPGELLSEYERFYEALLRLEVPVFLLPGNHDGYVNEIDGLRWFEENLGPLYYSFDLGDCHFACLHTYQWPFDDRVVMNKLAYMEPRKWQGQVLGAADEGDPSTYTGQLAWLEDDLSSHDSARLKVLAMHHDPYTPDGRAYSFVNVVKFPLYIGAGGGEGGDALLGVAARREVDVVLGGHQHRDRIGMVPWKSGGGDTVYSCQTCVYFGEGGTGDNYPGYRLVEVEGGEIVSLAYLDGVSSYPFYDGSVPGGETDLDGLERPALWAAVSKTAAVETWSASIEAGNYLGEDMVLNGIVLEAPEPSPGGYKVEGAELYRAVEMPGERGGMLLYLRAEVAAGVPGEAAGAPGDPTIHTITISY